MKRILFKSIALLSFFFICICASAQTQINTTTKSGGYDVLGTWCYGDIYINKTGAAGDVKCTIPVPPEGISGIYGVGAPSIINDLGDTVDIVFNAPAQLKVELDMKDGDIVYELYTNLASPIPSDIPCYYYVIIHVHFID